MSNSAYPYAPLSVIKSSGRYSLIGGPFGSKLGRKDYVDEGVPVVRGANLPDTERFSEQSWVYVSEKKADELRANLAFPGDIVVTQRGTIGQVGLIPADSPVPRYVLSQSQMKLTVDSELADPRYVYYALASPDAVQRLKDLSFSAGVPHINLGMFASFEIPVPPLPIQVAIADSLSAYDELIENNTRRIKILEEMAQSIYKEWFVNFRYPGHENVPLVDSELGPIPEGWRASNLGEVSLNFDRLRKPLSKMKRAELQGPYPYYGAARVFDFLEDYIFDGTYLLVAEDGSVMTSSGTPVLQYVTGKFWANNHTHILQGDVVSTEFLYMALREFPIQGYVTGAAQPKINQANLNRIPVLAASQAVQRAFDDTVKALLTLVQVLRAQNANLRATRDLLLPRLVSGEIDVAALDFPGE